ncbi:MAG: ATP-binding protein [Chloroflexota bacterium]
MSAGPDVPWGLASLSEDLRILSANLTMGALVGWEPAELVGKSFDVILSAPSRILFQTNVYPALRTQGRVEEVFLTLAASAGPATPVLLNAVCESNASGLIFQVLIVRIQARNRWESDLLAATRAIAEERAASQRLAAQLATAADDLAARYADEQRNREFRDAFVGVVSHELRTPITTIYGMSHVLRERFESMDPDAVRQHLGDIASESERLNRLTEDLLVLSRAEGGRLEIADDPVVVSRAVRNAVDSERMRSPDRTFEMNVPKGLPIVLGEDLYVEQVVRNYLSNAVKYSPREHPISVVASSEDGGVAVRVTDAGPGLGGHREELFELFYRAPDAIRKASGAGIGLFVCRELIQAMGGRIWALPAPARETGAEFGFWLPAADDPGDC